MYLNWKHLNGRALRVANPPSSLCGLSAALDVSCDVQECFRLVWGFVESDAEIVRRLRGPTAQGEEASFPVIHIDGYRKSS